MGNIGTASQSKPVTAHGIFNINRIEPMLQVIKQIWEKNPDLRFGQLICNIVPEEKLFCIEDDKMFEEMRKWIEK